jgi:hypothetical protein
MFVIGRAPTCLVPISCLLRDGSNARPTWRLIACRTPVRANNARPPCSAACVRQCAAACTSFMSCSSLGDDLAEIGDGLAQRRQFAAIGQHDRLIETLRPGHNASPQQNETQAIIKAR